MNLSLLLYNSCIRRLITYRVESTHVKGVVSLKNQLDTFLGIEIADAINKIDEGNTAYFKLLDELGQLTKRIVGDIRIESEDGLQVISSCLIIKAMNTMEAVVRLSRVCLISEAKALLRVLIEVVIIIRNLEEDPEYLNRYIKAHNVDRKNRLGIILDNPEYFMDLVNADDLPHYRQLKAEIEHEVRTNDIKERKSWQWANKVGLKELYDIAYRLFCADVHVGVQILENYLICDEEGNLSKLNIRPFDEVEIRAILHQAFDLFSMAFKSYLTIMKIESTEFDELWTKRIGMPRIIE